MAATNKTYLDLAGLQAYDGLIKAWVDGTGTGAQSSVVFRTVRYDSDNIYFYHKKDATGTDTADVTVPLTGSDVTKALAEISAIVTALGGEMAATAPYTVTFPGLTTEAKVSLVAAINELDAAIDVLNGADTVNGSVAKSIKNAIEGLNVNEFALASVASNVVNIKGIKEVDGKIVIGDDAGINLEEVAVTGAAADVSIADAGNNYTATNVEGALAEIPGKIADAIDALDTTNDVGIASKTGDVVTIKGSIKEENGIVKAGTAAEITLAAVAATGEADDVAYVNTTSGLQATNVQAAIDEVAAASAGGVNSKTVWLNSNETVTTGYLKTYGIYQGTNSYDAETNPATLIGKIDIPKDLVVTAGKVVTVEDGTDSDGETTSVADGTYVKLTIANQTEKIYINVHDLVDVYTAQQNATQVQLAISATNEISATIVAGSITATELASNAVTTVKIADDAVTADKIAIAAHSESQTHTGGTEEGHDDGLSITVTTTDGQVSAVTGSIAANTYDAYGAAANAVAALDGSATIASYTAGTASTADVITIKAGITEANGVVSNNTTDDITLSTITTTQINNLFA